MNWQKYSDESIIQLGTLLKLESGEILMVGDINLKLGYCGCCKEYDIDLFCNDLCGQIQFLKANV